MRHREIDRARLHLLGPRRRPAREADARLRPAGDLDLLPREADAAAERLADRLLAGEPPRVALRWVRLRESQYVRSASVKQRSRKPGRSSARRIRSISIRSTPTFTARLQPPVSLSSKSGNCAIELTTMSGTTPPLPRAPPAGTCPCARAPSHAEEPRAADVGLEVVRDDPGQLRLGVERVERGRRSTRRSACRARSPPPRSRTRARRRTRRASSIGPRDVCHHLFLCRQ